MRLARVGAPPPSRAATIAAAVDHLARDSRATPLRTARAELARLEPSAEEWAPHVSALLGLARSDAGPTVTLAQRALDTLDDAGLVPLPELLDAGAAILRRPARGTARTALARLTTLARRDDLAVEHVASVLLAASAAFDHPAIDVAERALEVVGSRAGDVPDDVRARLVQLAGVLDPALRARARTLLGPGPIEGAATAATGHDIAPTAPRAPWPVQDADPSAVVDLLSGRGRTLLAWESGLAAVVHLRATDPGGLRDAVRGLGGRDLGGTPEARDLARRLLRAIRSTGDGDPGPLGAVVSFLARLVRGGDPSDDAVVPGGPRDSPLPHLARLGEVGRLLGSHPVPLLLATPSRTDGTIEVDVLAERLARAAREGWEPWPLDLEQALLRVTVPLEEAELRRAVAGARALGTPAATRLAQWLEEGGLAEPRFAVVRVETGSPTPRVGEPSRPWSAATAEAPAVVPGAPGPLTTLLLRPTLTGDLEGRYRSGTPSGDVGWLALLPLPHHPELHAAWLLPHVARHRGSALGETRCTLTSFDGRVGDAVGAVLAHQLLGVPDARAAAVVVALHLSGRGQPWGAVTGAALAQVAAAPEEVVTRAVDPLRRIAAGGGAREALVLLVTALPPLALAGVRGLPDLLALASALVVEHGLPEHAGPELPDALAGISDGYSHTAREARRLLRLTAPHRPRSHLTALNGSIDKQFP